MDITEAAVVLTLRLRVETAVTPPPVAAVEATPYLPEVAVPTLPRAGEVVAVAIAILHPVEAAVVAAAIVQAAVPMAADDTKLTYEQGLRQAPQLKRPQPLPSFQLPC